MAVAGNVKAMVDGFYGDKGEETIPPELVQLEPTQPFYYDPANMTATEATAIAKEFKDSGDRQKFSTGAHRDTQTEKGRFDLIPPLAELLVARVFEEGGKKYTDRNWEKGIPVSRYIDSCRRHLGKYVAGLRDEPHLSMAAWNLMCALHTAAEVELGVYPRELFDLPNHMGTDSKPLSEFEVKSLWKP